MLQVFIAILGVSMIVYHMLVRQQLSLKRLRTLLCERGCVVRILLIVATKRSIEYFWCCFFILQHVFGGADPGNRIPIIRRHYGSHIGTYLVAIGA